MDHRDEGNSKKMMIYDPVAQRKLNQLSDQMEEIMDVLTNTTEVKINEIGNRTGKAD